jgi:hypothetical protein
VLRWHFWLTKFNTSPIVTLSDKVKWEIGQKFENFVVQSGFFSWGWTECSTIVWTGKDRIFFVVDCCVYLSWIFHCVFCRVTLNYILYNRIYWSFWVLRHPKTTCISCNSSCELTSFSGRNYILPGLDCLPQPSVGPTARAFWPSDCAIAQRGLYVAVNLSTCLSVRHTDELLKA